MGTLMVTTSNDVKAVLNIILAVGEAIQDLNEVSSGELYALLMGKMSIQTYTQIIEKLKDAKLVRESGHLLTWIGPRKKEN